jgi:hypothetical protein
MVSAIHRKDTKGRDHYVSFVYLHRDWRITYLVSTAHALMLCKRLQGQKT